MFAKQKLLFLAFLLVGVSMNTESASAHSGGTDKYGCHSGSMPFHCHNTGPTKEYLQHLQFNGMNSRASFRVVIRKHPSCEPLNSLYLRGVAVSKKAAEAELGRDTFLTLISKALYKINRHLDTNGNGIACGFLETENHRIPTYVCGMNEEFFSPQLTANDTYSRCTSSDPAMGGWKIEVLSVTPNAETAILAESARNVPAPPDQQYFVAKLRVTNLSAQSAKFPEEKLGTQSRSGRNYTHFGNSCGYLSNSNFLEYFSPGESKTANFCWRIYSSDVDGLLLYFQRDVYTLDWTSSLTGTKFYTASKAYSFVGMD